VRRADTRCSQDLPNCGYEYKEEDYDNKEAGEEFVAGSQIDEQGEVIIEEGVGAGEEKQPEAGNVPPRSQREREADSPEGPEASLRRRFQRGFE
jgi:hypothetical protein